MTVRLAELVSARLSDGRRVQRARGFRDSRHVLELFRKKKGHQGGIVLGGTAASSVTEPGS
jgi:hypothetical protein